MAQKKSSNTTKFHLGLTMAGAVSAGAYTAGFIDYLFEALELWQEKKDENIKLAAQGKEIDKTIPMHDVIIDVMGGASAGGMVSVMTALAAYQKMTPVKTPSYQKTGNILYDSWVLLDDDLDSNDKNSSQRTTLEKMLNTNDITDTKSIPSLLNTNSIDAIADKVFQQFKDKKTKIDRPKFISEDLRVLVTLCSLKGIPFDVSFDRIDSAHFDEVPSHRMYEHMIIAHFKTNYNETVDKDSYLEFNPYNASKALLKKCTTGTGAFPIGLKARHFNNELSTAYIKSCLKRNLSLHKDSNVTIKIKGDSFDFTNIDGGTINNEPYGEVIHVLKEFHGAPNIKSPSYGTIMIDPFPNFYTENGSKTVKDKTKFQKSIFQIIPKLYTTLREQVRVKRGNTFHEDYFRLMAFPLKWEHKGKLKNHPPLACGGLDGFGGFFDIEFRIHDFFLGRNNARNFLRYFFSLEYDAKNPHPLFQNITPEALKTFQLKPKEAAKEKGKTYLPIIPDINHIAAKKDKQTNPYFYTVSDFPKLNTTKFEKLRKPVQNRIKAMLKNEIDNRVKGWLYRKAIKLTVGWVSKKATTKIFKAILIDFKERKML